MGDRISFSFVSRDEARGEVYERESVTFFSHWDGMDFLDKVKAYCKSLKRKGQGLPLDRLEPGTMMVDFIRWFTKDMKAVDSNYYLGKDEDDGDNSDNGHHRIDVKTGVAILGTLEFSRIQKGKGGK
jgi:hypothetical protein